MVSIEHGRLALNKSSANDNERGRTNKDHRHPSLRLLFLVFIIILLSGCSVLQRGCSLWLLSCAVVDQYSVITVENHTATQVTILYNEDQIEGNGYKYSDFLNLGTIPAGQTAELRGPILGGIGAVPKVYLIAEDSFGKIIWEDTWSGEEFYDLNTQGLRVILNP
jgi:hypothetical protein